MTVARVRRSRNSLHHPAESRPPPSQPSAPRALRLLRRSPRQQSSAKPSSLPRLHCKQFSTTSYRSQQAKSSSAPSSALSEPSRSRLNAFLAHLASYTSYPSAFRVFPGKAKCGYCTHPTGSSKVLGGPFALSSTLAVWPLEYTRSTRSSRDTCGRQESFGQCFLTFALGFGARLGSPKKMSSSSSALSGSEGLQLAIRAIQPLLSPMEAERR